MMYKLHMHAFIGKSHKSLVKAVIDVQDNVHHFSDGTEGYYSPDSEKVMLQDGTILTGVFFF